MRLNLTLKPASLIMKTNKVIIFSIHLQKNSLITKKGMLFVLNKKDLGKSYRLVQEEKEDLSKLLVRMENFV